MKIARVTNRTSDLINKLAAIWEDSVRATHGFLSGDDIEKIRPQVFLGLMQIESLLCAYGNNEEIGGFMGIEGSMIEMLFIASDKRGNGLGRLLVAEAESKFAATHVDVNEQNIQGLQFYKHMGFVVTGRSNSDAQGNPFPILHMEKSR